MRWLRRKKLIDERPAEERSNEPHEVEPLEAWMQRGLFDGVFLRLGEGGVLGPNAPWRAAVVGCGRGGDAAAKATHDAPKRKRRKGQGKKKEDGNAAAILVDGGAGRGSAPEVGVKPEGTRASSVEVFLIGQERKKIDG